MRAYAAAAAILAALTTAGAAAADDNSGRWKVAGNVDGHDFTLDCKFQQQGEALTGVCVDGPTGDKTIKGGRAHPLIKGRVLGDQISWTYVSSYAFFKFTVDYSGVRKGDKASGKIAAAGKTGAFTAEHLGS
jgi:hypothetical protein